MGWLFCLVDLLSVDVTYCCYYFYLALIDDIQWNSNLDLDCTKKFQLSLEVPGSGSKMQRSRTFNWVKSLAHLLVIYGQIIGSNHRHITGMLLVDKYSIGSNHWHACLLMEINWVISLAHHWHSSMWTFNLWVKSLSHLLVMIDGQIIGSNHWHITGMGLLVDIHLIGSNQWHGLASWHTFNWVQSLTHHWHSIMLAWWKFNWVK